MNTDDSPTALIIGGTGGIGCALVDHLVREGRHTVHATHREGALTSNESAHWHPLDATNEAQIQILATQFQRVDLLINTIGALQTHDYGPEKSLRNISEAQLMSQMVTNALPTLLLAKHFTRSLKHAPGARIVALSARVGSIADNQLGGWYSYRASKAALNMLVKTLAIEWQRTLPAACVIAYHPGTVKTKLSEPFVGSQTTDSDSSSSEKRLLTPAEAAECLLTLTRQLQPEDSGTFWDWRHQIVPW